VLAGGPVTDYQEVTVILPFDVVPGCRSKPEFSYQVSDEHPRVDAYSPAFIHTDFKPIWVILKPSAFGRLLQAYS